MGLNYVKCSTCGREAVTKISGGIATFPALCLCGGSSFSALLTGPSEPEGMAALRKDAERYRKMRDRCDWSMTARPGLVRLVFRLQGDFNFFDDDNGNEIDALIDATHVTFQRAVGSNSSDGLDVLVDEQGERQ